MLSRRPGGGHRAPVAEQHQDEGEQDPLGELMQVPERRPRGQSTREDPLEKLQRKARAALSSTVPLDAEGLVGLFILRHEEVYGIFPEELRRKAMQTQGLRRAGAFLREHFPEEQRAEALAYVEWSWALEQTASRKAWAAQCGYRLALQGLLSAKKVTDFRVQKMQQKTQARPAAAGGGVPAYGPTRVNGRVVGG